MNQEQTKRLNKEQLEAVKHGGGPLLIIAGAGTGKTTVITARIKWLISQNLVKPSEILALTFTEKAAREMEERVDKILPYGVTQMWITTFHSFGERILRQETIHIGLNPGYRVMTEAEAVIFFRRRLFSFELEYFRPLGNPAKFIEGMLTHFARLKDEDISPSEYIRWVQNQKSKIKNQKENEEKFIEIQKYEELANAYKTYEELKMKEGVMDFSDLISNTLKLFRERKNILNNYQKQFKYILIDEFQDTNFAQNELAILLSGAYKNITVVADDDQAIYRWRGAAVSNVIQFRKNFPNAKIIVLTKNYRSTKNILDSSYKLIQHNNPDRLEVKEKINKKLKSQRGEVGEKVEFIYRERVEDEAEEIVKKIKNNQKESYAWKDFAILVRANNHVEPFTRALSRAGIPYQFLGPGMLFRQPEVMDLIAYLKLLNNPQDSVALFRVLSMEIFAISGRDISSFISLGRKIGINLFESLEVVVSDEITSPDHWTKEKNFKSYLPFINNQTKQKIAQFVKMVHRHLELIKKETAGQILYSFLEDSGLLDSFTKLRNAQEEKQAGNISRFFDKLKTFEIEHEDASVSAVADWIEMSQELGESPLSANTDWVENDAVNILTVHSSKGLEFPIVFVVNLVNQRFPSSERKERIPLPDELIKEVLPGGDYHEQEERRVFYVAATRARDRLVLTAAKYYGEAKRERKISPFVFETLGKEPIAMKQWSNETIKQLSLMEWKKPEEPQDVPVIKQPVNYLSYSQINTFLTCPLQYKYRYIIKIPTPATAAASFGSSLHASLQQFYELVKDGRNPTKEDLLSILERVWIPVGYGTKEYEEKMKKRGRNMLTEFYEKAYDPKIKPVNLEQLFKIRLTPSLTIGGKIDRIDRKDGGKLEIIDYKTGRRPSEKEIKENLQMTVYALAATDPGIYAKNPEEVILSFYFFDEQEKVSSQRTSEQIQQVKEKLKEIANMIESSDFKPTPGTWCDFCDFRLICPAWK